MFDCGHILRHFKSEVGLIECCSAVGVRAVCAPVSSGSVELPADGLL